MLIPEGNLLFASVARERDSSRQEPFEIRENGIPPAKDQACFQVVRLDKYLQTLKTHAAHTTAGRLLIPSVPKILR